MPLPSHRLHPTQAGRWRALVLALGMAFGLTAASAARAQSLQELYDAARGYDASYLAARSLADSAQYRLAQVKALRLPVANVTANMTRSGSDIPYRDDNVYGTANNVALNARQPLFNRANAETIAQAEKGFEVAGADLESAEQDLILRLSQAYFDVLAAQDTLANARASMKAIAELVASAKRNFEVGTATITDTREAQARFDLARAVELQADNDLITKRILLDQLVGRVNVSPKQLAVPVKLPDVVPANIDDWVSRADSEHPTVRRARLALDVAKLETGKARAGHLPTLDLVGSVGGSRNTGLSGAGTGSGVLPGTYRNAAIGVQLNVPIFAGFAVENRVKETLLLEDKSQNDLDAARRGVAQTTRTLFYGVRSGTAQVSALEAAESSSQLALEATQLGFKVGVRVNLDVLNAQSQLFVTRTQLAKARYDVVMANLRLRQASGRLTPEDVAEVNRLLQQ
jgi:outer membrane protein